MRRTSSKTSSLRPNDIFNEEMKPWRLLQRQAKFMAGWTHLHQEGGDFLQHINLIHNAVRE